MDTSRPATIEDLEPHFNFNGSENDMELHILENIEDISRHCNWGEIREVKSQYTMNIKKGKIRADIMIWHKDGTGTAIEVKNATTNRNCILAAIGQVLSYGWKMKSKLINEPRLVIASNQINSDIYETVKHYGLPISMLMVDGDRCIYLT